MAEQIEKSFQKQQIFHNTKSLTTTKKVAGKDRRWYKEVGLGFKVRLPIFFPVSKPGSSRIVGRLSER